MGSKSLQEYQQIQARLKKQLAGLEELDPYLLIPLFTAYLPFLPIIMARIEGMIQKIRVSKIFRDGRLRHKAQIQPDFYEVEDYPALEQGLAIALCLAHLQKTAPRVAKLVYADLEKRLEVVWMMEKELGVREKPTLAKELKKRKADALNRLKDKSLRERFITGLVTALLDKHVASKEQRGRRQTIDKAARELLGLAGLRYSPGSARKRMGREKQ